MKQGTFSGASEGEVPHKHMLLLRNTVSGRGFIIGSCSRGGRKKRGSLLHCQITCCFRICYNDPFKRLTCHSPPLTIGLPPLPLSCAASISFTSHP